MDLWITRLLSSRRGGPLVDHTQTMSRRTASSLSPVCEAPARQSNTIFTMFNAEFTIFNAEFIVLNADFYHSRCKIHRF